MCDARGVAPAVTRGAVEASAFFLRTARPLHHPTEPRLESMSNRSLQRSLSITVAVAMTTLCGVSAVAQVAEPPGRVGRVAYLTGTVSFRAGGDTAWAVAVPNSPVTTGDALWADNAGRV